ncbi:hypothetical protein PbB2_00060 [Candidatus Phycosocius bacilliformis]|uniref:Uncharacterized protein n=1 Tax=Candidatus Phycosocius bacilliformis TaxID=1445552 RepID=A0A2P2E5S5_9PROT|nr:hypothetical protein PbB2_00060 [Candidatus Phycosocius bacilliformis]
MAMQPPPKLDMSNLKAGKQRFIGATINGIEHAMIPKSDHDALLSSGEALLEWARSYLMEKPIETAPRDGTYILVKVTDDADRCAGRLFVSRILHDDDVALYPGYASGTEFLSHWRPIFDTKPGHLPEPLEAFAEALKRVRRE